MLDIYECDLCHEDFAVREGKEPNSCPFCQSLYWNSVESVKVVSGVEQAKKPPYMDLDD